jgi:MerR family transcriptional regulator, thiopeptide resistance regulator
VSGYTVSEVAKLSGVSVRTLHHYDEIGLLKPDSVGANGYRYYGRDELLRLQQILFHRELGFALSEIARILDDPGFDRPRALRAHRETLQAESRRYRRLVKTVDETLAELEGDQAMKETAMFKGFDPKKQAEHEGWLVERGGEPMKAAIATAKAGMKDWKQAQYDAAQAEQMEIEAAMATALTEGLPADCATVQALMKRHHAWIEKMWNRPASGEAYAGLGELYQSHPEFRARYEARATGLTDYLAEAMRVFAARSL